MNPRGCTHGPAQLDGAVAMLRERDYACIDASSRSVILRFLVEEFMHTPLQLVRIGVRVRVRGRVRGRARANAQVRVRGRGRGRVGVRVRVMHLRGQQFFLGGLGFRV